VTDSVIRDLHDAIETTLENAFPGAQVSPLVGDLYGADTFAVVWQLAENPPLAFHAGNRTFVLNVTVQVKASGDNPETIAETFNKHRDAQAALFRNASRLTNVNGHVAGAIVEDLGESIPEQAAQLGLTAVTRSATIACAT